MNIFFEMSNNIDVSKYIMYEKHYTNEEYYSYML